MSEARVTVAPLSREQSLKALIMSGLDDLKHLVRMEKELAVAEAVQALKRLGPAIGAFAVAAVAGVFIALMGSIALAFGAADLFGIGLGWGFLIVAGLWLLAGAVGGLLGLRLVKQIPAPERTIRTVKDTADWARHPLNAASAATDVS